MSWVYSKRIIILCYYSNYYCMKIMTPILLKGSLVIGVNCHHKEQSQVPLNGKALRYFEINFINNKVPGNDICNFFYFSFLTLMRERTPT